MIEEIAIVEYVRRSTADLFATMLGLEISNEPEYTDRAAPSVSDGVLAVVGLAGSWTGTGAVSCSAAFACRICNQLLMTDATAVNGEVLDAVGEVANMIVGNFKTMLEGHLGPLGLSIPTVIYGRNVTSRTLGANQWYVVPFRSESELLTVRCCLAPTREHAVRRGHSHPSTAVA